MSGLPETRAQRLARETSEWLNQNDPRRSVEDVEYQARTNDRNRSRCTEVKPGKRSKFAPRGDRYPREKAAGKQLETMKAFVERHRDTKSHDCIFVPVATPGHKAAVMFCGKAIPASRYACLLKNGAPKSDGLHARHLCGNGHLNCINPNHLVWGSPGDNIADANKHRALGEDATAQDKINAID